MSIFEVGTIEVAAHNGFALMRGEKSQDGHLCDRDGDPILFIPWPQMAGAEQALPSLVAMYQKGVIHGKSCGRSETQLAMRKALGL